MGCGGERASLKRDIDAYPITNAQGTTEYTNAGITAFGGSQAPRESRKAKITAGLAESCWRRPVDKKGRSARDRRNWACLRGWSTPKPWGHGTNW